MAMLLNHKTLRGIAALSTLLAGCAAAQTLDRSSPPYAVAYDHPPAIWYTPIGFVDDWQKSMVDQDGGLVYDFGPGPYARPKTTVAVDLASGSTDSAGDPGNTTQTLLDARIPVVITRRNDANGVGLHKLAFSLVPDDLTPPTGVAKNGSFIRRQGLVGSAAWAPDQPNVDPAFRSVAWGTGRAIQYDLRVPQGARRRVALGFNEVYRSGKILRVMNLAVEGAETLSVDLFKRGGQNTPQVLFFDGSDVNGDGWINVAVEGSPTTQDPNVFVNGVWMFAADWEVSEADVVSGRASAVAETHIDAGMEVLRSNMSRQDVIRASLNDGQDEIVVRVKTIRPLSVDAASASLMFEGAPFVTTNPGYTEASSDADGWTLSFALGTREVDVVVSHGRSVAVSAAPGVRAGGLASLDLAEEQRKLSSYWQDVRLPWGRLTVPDPDIQDLLDGGIRTLYQVREVVDGYPQFQPGASVYRGLWFSDGAWAVETAALLDDGESARLMLDAMLAHQGDDGRLGVMKPSLLHRETAHFVYAMCVYARLHHDWDWLDERWDQLARAVDHMIDLRRRASQDPEALYFGLFPPGYTDGGIGGVGASYGSVYWGLIAMAEVTRMAESLGRPEADTWRTEYADFLAAFQRASIRDTRRDENGNAFLPIKMDFDPEKDLPQRGQWGPLQAVFPGKFIAPDDPLIEGTLAMLDTRLKEQSVVSLGWLTGGVWPIFEAHRAITYLWRRDPDRAEQLLYTFAVHASPTLVWAEEQLPQRLGARIAGDVPHTMGNMQVVRVIRYMLLLERGNDLEVLAGLPITWLRPGARLVVESLPTQFGPVTIRLEIAADGQRGVLSVLTPGSQQGVVRVDLRRLKAAGFGAYRDGALLPDDVIAPWNGLFELEFATRGE